MRNPSIPKVNCSFPQHMLNYLWTSMGISLTFTMETNAILQCMHTHREQLPRHPAARWLKASATRLIHSTANWTLSQPSVYQSMFHSLSFSLLFFALFLWYISFVMSYLLSAEDKVLQCSVGLALGWVVTEEKRSSAEIPRDAQRCSWTGTARTHPPPLSPLVRAAAAAAANQKGRGKKN